MKIFNRLFSKKPQVPSLILNVDGLHHIGGQIPPSIKIPILETSPMVYLGCISKNEPEIKIIDFDLHLICPIFLDLQLPIFFDYSDPNSPQVIKENVSTNFNQLFDDIPYNAHIQYQRLNFSFALATPNKTKIGIQKIDFIHGQIGNFREPIWIHDENWPYSPINGQKMKFLFQLGDIDDCKNEFGQDVLDKEHIDNYLHFGHGYMYVFYEPESKVIAYLNQL